MQHKSKDVLKTCELQLMTGSWRASHADHHNTNRSLVRLQHINLGKSAVALLLYGEQAGRSVADM